MEGMLSFHYRKLLTKHSQLLHAHGMDVDEEMRSLSLSEVEGSIVSAAGSHLKSTACPLYSLSYDHCTPLHRSQVQPELYITLRDSLTQ